MRHRLYVFANAISPPGTMGGNTRIFLEIVKRWTSKLDATIVTTEDGKNTCKNYGLTEADFFINRLADKLINRKTKSHLKTFLFDILNMIESIFLIIRSCPTLEENDLIYSATEFYPDVIPALVLKLKYRKKIKWIAGFWLFAPSPFSDEPLFKDEKIKRVAFYFYQMPIYMLVNKFADVVFVTSDPDVNKFITKKRSIDKILVVKGGVDSKLPQQVIDVVNKEYDCVFIGRFHEMKGVMELIDIWKYVTETKAHAKLAMIGNGPLEDQVKKKIMKHGLENNIILFGFKDGIEKIKIIKSSKVAVHPAIFDSGGMAVCESMVCGLPAISFDLEALKTYYPKGVIKIPCYDVVLFARSILQLIDDKELYEVTAKNATELAMQWDWDKRATDILKQIS